VNATRLFFVILILGALAGGLVYFLRPAGEGVPPSVRQGEVATPVIIAVVRKASFADRIEALGTLKANETVVITASVTGIVRSVNFDDGMTVKKGRLLVQLDDDQERAELQSALAKLEEQKKQYERLAGLVKKNAASQARLDEQIATLKKARADVAIARARLDDRRIAAPFTGRLGNREISPGALVVPGTEIARLDDTSIVKLDFAVPETELAMLSPGLEIETRSPAFPGRVFTGRVRTVQARVDPVTRSVMVRVELPNPRGELAPGQLMTVELIENRRQALLIPEEALVPFGERQFVYVVSAEERARRIEVTIGGRAAGVVEVTDGLSPGDRVVVEGTLRLRPGARARIKAVREIIAGKTT